MIHLFKHIYSNNDLDTSTWTATQVEKIFAYRFSNISFDNDECAQNLYSALKEKIKIEVDVDIENDLDKLKLESATKKLKLISILISILTQFKYSEASHLFHIIDLDDSVKNPTISGLVDKMWSFTEFVNDTTDYHQVAISLYAQLRENEFRYINNPTEYQKFEQCFITLVHIKDSEGLNDILNKLNGTTNPYNKENFFKQNNPYKLQKTAETAWSKLDPNDQMDILFRVKFFYSVYTSKESKILLYERIRIMDVIFTNQDLQTITKQITKSKPENTSDEVKTSLVEKYNKIHNDTQDTSILELMGLYELKEFHKLNYTLQFENSNELQNTKNINVPRELLNIYKLVPKTTEQEYTSKQKYTSYDTLYQSMVAKKNLIRPENEPKQENIEPYENGSTQLSESKVEITDQDNLDSNCFTCLSGAFAKIWPW